MGATDPTGKPTIEKCLIQQRKGSKNAPKKPGDTLTWEATIVNPSIYPIHGIVFDPVAIAAGSQVWSIENEEGTVLYEGEGDLDQAIVVPPQTTYVATISAVISDKCLPFTITNVMSFFPGKTTTIAVAPDVPGAGGVPGVPITIEGVIATTTLTATPTLITDILTAIDADPAPVVESVPDECAEPCEAISEPCVVGSSDDLPFDPCVPGCADDDLLAALFDITDGEMARLKDMLNCGFNFLDLCEKALDELSTDVLQEICDLVIAKFDSPELKAIIEGCIADQLVKDNLEPVIVACIEATITKDFLAGVLQA